MEEVVFAGAGEEERVDGGLGILVVDSDEVFVLVDYGGGGEGRWVGQVGA